MKNYRAELVGVFGDPVDGNPTGVMMEAAFKDKDLNYRYLTIKVLKEDLEEAMKALRILNMKGIGLTMPHKVQAISYLDELSKAAAVIGAVNTVVVRKGKLYGENTDGKGFVQALKNRSITLQERQITILGAGGAAKAIAVECALEGAASIRIINRTVGKAQELVDVLVKNTEVKASWEEWKPHHKIPANTEILINATSVGLHPHDEEKPDIDYGTIQPGMVAADVVFNPIDTLFLKEARQQGAETIDGLGMLVYQGVLGFELWTGEKPSPKVMEDALKKEFSQ